ncbi:iron-containing alcohol dehydrogenase [Sedimentitalea sp. JM2-8]|uniref:Iron-containing alcohol dehydrogenase n=1 Tax=Sedimentitalea xiamensis TaxID=3050037 RepID=A0ABT7FJ06_9RHOB|nr:iron-containing alcohol dehydrogenase [Sedimentitalea xiamensis]MDK3075115.1 iron-containing alcohol dehydrogenase [Sedimentitalea xiamensis]
MTADSGSIGAFSFLTARQIRFARGVSETAHADVAGFGTRVLLVRGRSVPWVDGFCVRLSQAGCEVTTVVQSGEPLVADVETAVDLGRAAGTEVVVAVGGGAVIDLGKAVAALVPANGRLMDYLESIGGGNPLLSEPLPFIALPTTAGTGAEVTKNAVIGVPESGRKVSLRSDSMLPTLAIVDPALTDGSPRNVTLASGLDAVTQCIEPYLSTRANPLTDALCRASIPDGLAALARLSQTDCPRARDRMACTSLTGGIALANAGLGAVHGLAGVIGGRYHAPHGLICGRLLGPVLSLNARSGIRGRDRYDEIAHWIAAAFGCPAERAFDHLTMQLDQWELPRLGAWISPGSDLGAIAADAAGASSMRTNPEPLTHADLVRAVELAL